MTNTTHPPPDAEALDKLIAAVEAGTAGRTECFRAAFTRPAGRFGTETIVGFAWRAYHGSLDAALALHDALLPGWDWGRASAPGNGFWVRGQATPFFWSGKKSPPARAWLLAILRAHRNQQDPRP